MARYIFITGGVASSLGKGVASASLGTLLQARGYRVRLRKLDPYLNVDPGTMSPYQHGEVFVTDDGAETDLDLGHYERFTDVSARRSDNVTTGRIYQTILEKERRGDYLGATIQVIPHVTDAIKDFITAETDNVDFMLCEIGGTVGDIEGQPYLEAIRQLAQELGPGQCVFVHLTLLPFIAKAGEMKTKPTQHSVKELRSTGIQPDILLCRCERPIHDAERKKLALFCNVRAESVVEAPDLEHIYDAPLDYHRHGLDREVLRHAGIEDAPCPDMARWQQVAERQRAPDGTVRIALVGKYTSLPDAYKSVTEALDHGGLANCARIDLRWVEAEALDEAESAVSEQLGEVDGILLPGGFGRRGAEGKIRAARYAREQKIPFLGICFGMQLAVIEVARHLADMAGAGTREFGEPKTPIIGLLEEWMQGETRQLRDADSAKGGTMRLGAYPARLAGGSRVAEIYQTQEISERHRHRYEVNPACRQPLEAAGLRFSGLSPDESLPEIVELEGHPWYIGVQFHPELKSRPFRPHPLFASFVKAALERSRLV